MSKLLPDYKEFEYNGLIPFSNIRLVAVDLDGTLLKGCDSPLPKKFLEFTRKLHRYDVRLTIATGRTLNGTRSLINELFVRNDTPVVLYNGSVIINNKFELLFRKTLSAESLAHIVGFSSKLDVKILAYSYERSSREPREHAFGWSSLDKPFLEYNMMPVKWLDWNEKTIDYAASAVVIHTLGDEANTKKICAELSTLVDISYTLGKSYIEIGPKNSNKGTALAFAANVLNLSRDQVLALGDNDNDAEMLAWAGIGVAVKAASNLAIQNCNFVTKRGVVDGAIEMMKIVHSSRRLFT